MGNSTTTTTPSVTSTAPSTPAPVTANGENGWTGITITAEGIGQTTFSAASVSHNVVNGQDEIGVIGNTTPGNSPPNQELGYDPVTKTSEQLQAVFQAPVNNIKVGLDLFYGSENSTGEIGQWTAYDANGKEVGTGTFKNTAGASTDEITIQASCDFTKVVFSALPYSNQGTYVGDSSDYDITYITYTPQPPVIHPDAISVNEKILSVSGNAFTLAGDSSADNGLAVSGVSFGTHTATAGQAINGTYGALTINANGTFTYLPASSDNIAAGKTGVDTFNLTLTDGGTNYNTTFTVTVTGNSSGGCTITPSASPIINADHLTVNEGSGAHTGSAFTLAGDVASTGSSLTITAVNSLAAEVGQDIQGKFGILQLDKNGDYHYTPTVTNLPAGQTDTETFNFTVVDQSTGITTVVPFTVTIDGVTPPPVIHPDMLTVSQTVTSVSGNAFTLAGDTSSDNGLAVSSIGFGTHTASAGQSIDGAYGSLTINANGTFTYLPAPSDHIAAGQTGVDTFNLTLTDGGKSYTTTFTVTVDGSTSGCSVTPSASPIINADHLTVNEGSGANMGSAFTLAGDVASTGSSLTITAVNSLAAEVGQDIQGKFGILQLDKNGDYHYTPTVTNLPAGQTDTETFNFTVVDQSTGITTVVPFTVTIDGVTPPPVIHPDMLTVSQTVTSVSGNAFTLAGDTSSDNGLAVSSIGFGTHTASAGQSIDGAYGSLTINANGTFTYLPAPSDHIAAGQTGVDTFNLTLTDGGKSYTTTFTVTVDGSTSGCSVTPSASPIINADHLTVNEGSGANMGSAFTLAGDVASTGSSLTITAVNSLAAEVGQDIQGKFGILQLDKNGDYHYTPTVTNLPAGQADTETFSFTVVDQSTGITTVVPFTVTVDGVTPPPVIHPDMLTVSQTVTSVSGNAFTLAGDTSSDNGLAVSGVSFGTHTASAGQSIDGAYGSLTINANGTFTYLPAPSDHIAAGQTGVDTFNLTLTDGGKSYTTTFTVTVDGSTSGCTVTPSASPLVNADYLTVNEGSGAHTGSAFTLAGDVASTGSSLTITAVNSLAAEVGQDIQGKFGILQLDKNGDYHYTPTVTNLPAGQTDTETFNFTVVDQSTGITTVVPFTVTVDGVTPPPVIHPDMLTVSQTVTSVSGNAFTLAGDTSSDNGLAVSSIGFGTHTASAGQSIDGAYGSLTINANGTFTYLPAPSDHIAAGQTGVDTFNLTLTDGGKSYTTTFTVTVDGSTSGCSVTPSASPIINADHLTVNEGSGANMGSAFTLAGDVASTGSSLTITAVNGVGAEVGQDIQGKFGILQLDKNGDYHYTPTVTNLPAGQADTETFNFTVVDQSTGITTVVPFTVTIDGVTPPPVIHPDMLTVSQTVNSVSGNAFTLAGDTSSDNGLAVSSIGFGTHTASAGQSIDGAYGSLTINANGTFTYLPAPSDHIAAGQTGVDTFNLTLTDGGKSYTTTFTVTVDGSTSGCTVTPSASPLVNADYLTVNEGSGAHTGSAFTLAGDEATTGSTLAITAVNGQTAEVGQSIVGHYGTLVLNGDGTYVYTPTVTNLPAGQTDTETFNFTVVDQSTGITTVVPFDVTINGVTPQTGDCGCYQVSSSNSDDRSLFYDTNVAVHQDPGSHESLTGLSNVSYNLLQGDGNDVVTGGNNTAVNDIKSAVFGNDALVGGDGAGTVNYITGGADATNDICGGKDGAINNIYGNGDINTAATPFVGGNTVKEIIHGGYDATNNIWGGSGHNEIYGGNDSTNTIYGGAGNDTITGGNSSTNLIYTETGQDTVTGGTSATNTIYGGAAASTLIGGDSSTNTIYGGGGNDTIEGGNNHSTNVIYGGGGSDKITGGDSSNNTFYAEWGDKVTITGGNNATNTFYDGGGDDTYKGGTGDNFFVFNDYKYPVGSQGVQGNTTYPVALADQNTTGPYQFVSSGHDYVYGNVNSTDNVVELKGTPGTWTINVSDPASGTHSTTDGSWTAATGQTLSGTITSSVSGAVITFDHINQVKFIS